MRLDMQIKSLIISFLYGIIISYLIKVNYKYLFSKKIVLKIIVTSLFVLDLFLAYFLILKMVNNGIFHLYFFIVCLIGYMLGNYLIRNWGWHFCVNISKMSFYFIEIA